MLDTIFTGAMATVSLMAILIGMAIFLELALEIVGALLFFFVMGVGVKFLMGLF